MAPGLLADLLVDPGSRPPTPRRPVGRALGGSLIVHAIVLALPAWAGFHAA